MFEVFLGEIGRLGLLADVCGAILVGRAVFYVKNKEIFNNSAGFYGFNFRGTKERIAAKYESVIGLIFLISGFLAQYLASFTDTRSKPKWMIDFLFVIFCIFVFVLTVYLSSKIAEAKTHQLVKERDEEKQGSSDT